MISEATKRANKKYQQSKKGKIAVSKYWKSKKGKAMTKKKRIKYYKKDAARNKLNMLLDKHNILNNEFICAICGKQPIEKHHEDYDSWNCFISLCNSCHSKIHNMEKRYNDKK